MLRQLIFTCVYLINLSTQKNYCEISTVDVKKLFSKKSTLHLVKTQKRLTKPVIILMVMKQPNTWLFDQHMEVYDENISRCRSYNS